MRLIDIEAPCKIEIELDGEKCHATVTAPTVDAVPVWHKEGEWIAEPNCMFRCSHCGEHYPSVRGYMDFPYCPFCGARMHMG